MITQDLYPTDVSIYDGDLVLAQSLSTLGTAGTANLGAPYYLGYIAYDDFPKLLTLYTQVDDNNFIAFEEIKANHSWGYLFSNATGGSNSYPPTFICASKEDGTGFVHSNANRYNFINSVKMCNVATVDAVNLTLTYTIVPTADIDENGTTEFHSPVGNLYTSQIMQLPGDNLLYPNVKHIGTILEIINGTQPLKEADSISFSIGEETITRSLPDLNYSDFNEAGFARLDVEEGDYTFFFAITDFYPLAKSSLRYNNNTQYFSCDIVPFFETQDNGNNIIYSRLLSTDVSEMRVRYYIEAGIYRANNVPSITIDGNTYYECMVPYSINPSDFLGMAPQKSAVINGEYFLAQTGYTANFYEWRFFNHYSLEDIYKYMLYFHKIQTGVELYSSLVPQATYTTDFSTALYNEHDAATGERESADFEDIEDVLRVWQMPEVDITDNPYDPSTDKPEYNPDDDDKPFPVETEGKFSGDPTFGFVSKSIPPMGTVFYALNMAELGDFQECLWSQTKNFYDAIQIAGKQNTSIFEYITCLRYFPMNIDWKGDSPAQPVLMGTGAVFKQPNSDDNFQLSPIDTSYKYDTHSATWHLSDSDYRWRGNFLDYSPYTKITIFLPFAGTVELNPEQIASHTNIDKATIYLSTTIDAASGSITYVVFNQNDVILAEKTGKVAIDLPLSGNNNAAQAQAIIEAQFRMGKQLLGNSVGVASSVAGNAMNGNLIGALTGAGTSTFNNIISTAEAYIQNSLAHKQVPVEIGSFGGVLSNIAVSQIPYITVYRQKVANPENYGHTTGFLVEGTYLISALEGFTKCNNVDVSGISQATDKEKAQIKQILESGFYCPEK